jgi:hypothetical protein
MGHAMTMPRLAGLPRLDGWPERLSGVLADHADRPFEWGGRRGGSDCHMLAMDAVLALTGVDPYPDERGRYTTPIGAKRLFGKRGFGWLDDAYDAVFERTAPALARRGDIGLAAMMDPVLGPVDCAAVVAGADAWGKGREGILRVPTLSLAVCWRVGA